MEQRQYVRAELSGTEVYISDRAGFCKGILKNFSRFGLCITDIPRKVHTKNGYFVAVIPSNTLNLKLKVKERWRTKDGLSTEIGAGIEDTPWEWTEMVMRHEPPNHDVWATQ
jgi:hypothetical protein